jgi:hypothetical protein
MEKSESIKELATALAKAQGEIKGALKDSANPFFKSKYADLSSVVEAIRGPLAVHGLSYVQIAHDSDNSAKIETLILHNSGEWLSCGAVSVPVSKADAQGFGSAMTYARRYGLSAAFGVAPEDDDGNAAAKNPPKKVATEGFQISGPDGVVTQTTITKQETPGQIVDTELSIDGMTPEMVKALRIEAMRIMGDFLTIGAKAALGSWTAFKKDADEREVTALWSLLDSKTRSGIKKAGQATEAANAA